MDKLLNDSARLKKLKESGKIDTIVESLKGKISDQEIAAVIGGLVSAMSDRDFALKCRDLMKRTSTQVTCCQNVCISGH